MVLGLYEMSGNGETTLTITMVSYKGWVYHCEYKLDLKRTFVDSKFKPFFFVSLEVTLWVGKEDEVRMRVEVMVDFGWGDDRK